MINLHMMLFQSEDDYQESRVNSTGDEFNDTVSMLTDAVESLAESFNKKPVEIVMDIVTSLISRQQRGSDT